MTSLPQIFLPLFILHIHTPVPKNPGYLQVASSSLEMLHFSRTWPTAQHTHICCQWLRNSLCLSKAESWLVSNHCVSFQMLQVHFCCISSMTMSLMSFPISLYTNHSHSTKNDSSTSSFLGPSQIVLPSSQSPYFTAVHPQAWIQTWIMYLALFVVLLYFVFYILELFNVYHGAMYLVATKNYLLGYIRREIWSY